MFVEPWCRVRRRGAELNVTRRATTGSAIAFGSASDRQRLSCRFLFLARPPTPGSQLLRLPLQPPRVAVALRRLPGRHLVCQAAVGEVGPVSRPNATACFVVAIGQAG